MTLRVPRRLSKAHVSVLDSVAWERRDASITGVGGRPVFAQAHIEVPAAWSTLASNVVASKYFRGEPGQREDSVRSLLGRVVGEIVGWAAAGQLLAGGADVANLEAELTALLLHQMASFNSPVWFNVGVEARPQCSACFINAVEDSLESILELCKTEGLLFQFGSGTGSNLSPLRASMETIRGGGTASGPVSFMRGFDAFAGVIKSGGKTRRAAKMVILDVDHPDILTFIDCKAREERKAWALIDAGYDGSVDGEAYGSVFFQNSNNSVRVPDAFMQAVLCDATVATRARVSGAVESTLPARAVWRRMAEAAHACGDPGVQFDTTINAWHTCPAAGPIRASNPCSEYMFLDDTACNLASLNLLRFVHDSGNGFDAPAFVHAVEVMLLAQETLVDAAGYPTEAIARNSRAYRPLGLGYANLGALLMHQGLPYDSDAGRALAAGVTALMTAAAYRHSARMAAVVGPFTGFAANRAAMLRVIAKHRAAAGELAASPLAAAAAAAWDEALQLGERVGYRNAQVTVLAPTGTIAFMMDCDTTGVEPELALIKHKALVGGGSLELVNGTVPTALTRLGYDTAARERLMAHLRRHHSLADAHDLKPEHAAVFDCAFAPPGTARRIAPAGHVRMMMALQPFLSGAISKTVNLPTDATVEDIENIFMAAWQGGLKSVAVYRDGCKRSQPLRVGTAAGAQADAPVCAMCGTTMVRAGPCFRCENCGTSSACS